MSEEGLESEFVFQQFRTLTSKPALEGVDERRWTSYSLEEEF